MLQKQFCLGAYTTRSAYTVGCPAGTLASLLDPHIPALPDPPGLLPKQMRLRSEQPLSLRLLRGDYCQWLAMRTVTSSHSRESTQNGKLYHQDLEVRLPNPVECCCNTHKTLLWDSLEIPKSIEEAAVIRASLHPAANSGPRFHNPDRLA